MTDAHTKFYLSAVVLTSIVLYMAGRIRARTVVGKIGRIILQILIIGAGLLLVSMASQWSGVYGLLTENPIRDLTLMTLISYCFVYRRERRWFAGVGRFFGMSVVLALMLGAGVLLWQTTRGTIVSAMLIPAVLPLMRWIEKRLFREPALKVKPGRKLSSMHYASNTFEIRYEAGTNELLVRCRIPENTATRTTEEDFNGSISAIYHASGLALGERWVPNIKCTWWDETVTRYKDNSTTTYIAGTTSTGYSSSGEIITVSNPGTTITIPGNETYSVEEKTGKYVASLYMVIKDMGHNILLKGIPPKNKPALESVIEAIRAALEDRCRQHNTQEVTAVEVERQEKAEAARFATESAQQAMLKAKDGAQRRSIALMEQAGLRNTEGDFFVDYQHDQAGAITSLLATDREARGVLVAHNGADIWTGSWKGAVISYLQAEREMHFKVVDEAYRQKHMKERRLVVRGWNHALCVEWQDRINLLNVE